MSKNLQDIIFSKQPQKFPAEFLRHVLGLDPSRRFSLQELYTFHILSTECSRSCKAHAFHLDGTKLKACGVFENVISFQSSK